MYMTPQPSYKLLGTPKALASKNPQKHTLLVFLAGIVQKRNDQLL